MEKLYKLNNRKMIIFLLIFLLASSVLTYISIKDNIEQQKILEKYDDSIKRGGLNILEPNFTEKMNYNKDSQKHSLGIFRTILICGIEIIILYLYFLKNSKIVIDENGIKIYNLYKRKPSNIYNWEGIENISFQYAEDIRGFIPAYGMKIKMIKRESIFIPIEKFLNYEEISDVVMNYYDNIEIIDNNEETYSITKLLKDSYEEYKSGFDIYIKYSFIILTFDLLKELIKNPIVDLIVLIAQIFFGYRALIALNYRVYMSYNGENIDFDTGWEFAKDKIGRYFGAGLILEISMLIFIGIEYLFITSSLEFNYKIILSIVLVIVCIISISRIYLITYIASIVDTNESYMSLNGIVIKKYYKQVIFMFFISNIILIPIIILGIMNYKDLYSFIDIVGKISYIRIALDLFITPFVSCYFMKLLKDLPISVRDGYNE
ncbi:hypothetical protein [Tepidibacter aestuarii]|uniref:hypothetical protein n=1 Tax=Tepidibacter aestuarii TaxID=2925782 RepID=UPI0020BEF14A|nr:hypothetical protein [Tepidibacter aestuarii]CAH2214195.1 conserved membrane protein of unknown function [Tepidibacter aestuarii]